MRRKLYATLVIIITMLGSIFAQQRVITGTITSASDGLTLPGVTVTVKEVKNVGTISDTDGKYSLKVPENATALTFSFVGMITQTVKLGAGNVVNVAMEPSVRAIDEVVVTALGIQREKKALGFAAQEVGEEALSGLRETNLASLLTAKVAGVQIYKTAAGTGGSSSVLIRGASSLSGSNQPLYVVDGVPIINLPKDKSGGAGGSGDNDYGDGIGDINTEDIASMTVLKGPNASALYGSRGANGVILITTKSGKKKQGIGVEVNSNVSIETLNLFPSFQNQYATGYEETNIYGSMVLIDGKYYETMDTWHTDSYGPPLDGRRTIVDPFVYPADKNKKTLVLLPQPEDNVRKFYERGFLNTNTVELTGGNEKSSARLLLGNTTSKGIVPNERIKKQTVSFRSTTDLTDFLSFDAKITYVRTEGKQRPNLGSSGENVSYTLSMLGRYVPMPWLKEYYETTGDFGKWPGVVYNPYYVVNELKNEDYRDRFFGYSSVRLKMTDWLSMTGRLGADIYTESAQKTWPVGANGSANSAGRITTDFDHNKEINADVLLMASKQLSSNLSGTLSVGANYLKQKRDSQSMDARKFKAKGVYHVSNCQTFYPSAYLWEKEMQSVFFTGQLAYKNYLFLDVTGRNDWSSALGVNEQSFFYPSVSGSFVFTDAADLGKSILSFGKIRASWAQVGNDSSPYMTRSGYTSYTAGYNGQSYTSKSGRIPLFNLKNELSESWEIGADLRFFQNRLSFDVTYYNGHTTNQIIPITISSASGYTEKVINAGRIDNRGIEAMVNITPVMFGGFKWDLSANFARNKSKVVELAPGVETYMLADVYPADVEARVGDPYGNIIGYAYKKAPDGQRIIGPGGGHVREAQTSVLGNIQPDWIGGLNNTFSYKGLSLNVLLDFKIGGELVSSTKYHMTAKGTGKWTTEGRRLRDTDDNGNQLPLVGVLDGVVEVEGPGGTITYEKNTKAVDGQTYWANRAWSEIGEEFVLDASYISLREIMLSYRFQQRLVNKTPFSGLTVSLIGRNLAYLREHMQDMGVSPESHPNTDAGYMGVESFSAPTTRTFGLNLKLTF
jgi:TonB-linked SusC/RagA family outer membrane protein